MTRRRTGADLVVADLVVAAASGFFVMKRS
jgi:hypothetical protein